MPDCSIFPGNRLYYIFNDEIRAFLKLGVWALHEQLLLGFANVRGDYCFASSVAEITSTQYTCMSFCFIFFRFDEQVDQIAI